LPDGEVFILVMEEVGMESRMWVFSDCKCINLEVVGREEEKGRTFRGL
jgi:hypothetical protein